MLRIKEVAKESGTKLIIGSLWILSTWLFWSWIMYQDLSTMRSFSVYWLPLGICVCHLKWKSSTNFQQFKLTVITMYVTAWSELPYFLITENTVECIVNICLWVALIIQFHGSIIHITLSNGYIMSLSHVLKQLSWNYITLSHELTLNVWSNEDEVRVGPQYTPCLL